MLQKRRLASFGGVRESQAPNPNRERDYRGDIATVCAKLNTFIDMPRRTNDLVSTGLQLRPVAQREIPVCSRLQYLRITNGWTMSRSESAIGGSSPGRGLCPRFAGVRRPARSCSSSRPGAGASSGARSLANAVAVARADARVGMLARDMLRYGKRAA
jgi:hypothetical protein